MILLIIFAFGVLVSCWIWADVMIRTKCIFTVLYLATWGLAYIPFHSLYLFPLSQAAFAIIVGGVTFGIDWLMKDIWRGPR